MSEMTILPPVGPTNLLLPPPFSFLSLAPPPFASPVLPASPHRPRRLPAYKRRRISPRPTWAGAPPLSFVLEGRARPWPRTTSPPCPPASNSPASARGHRPPSPSASRPLPPARGAGGPACARRRTTRVPSAAEADLPAVTAVPDGQLEPDDHQSARREREQADGQRAGLDRPSGGRVDTPGARGDDSPFPAAHQSQHRRRSTSQRLKKTQDMWRSKIVICVCGSCRGQP
jgi:hypothetical protein